MKNRYRKFKKWLVDTEILSIFFPPFSTLLQIKWEEDVRTVEWGPLQWGPQGWGRYGGTVIKTFQPRI